MVGKRCLNSSYVLNMLYRTFIGQSIMKGLVNNTTGWTLHYVYTHGDLTPLHITGVHIPCFIIMKTANIHLWSIEIIWIVFFKTGGSHIFFSIGLLVILLNTWLDRPICLKRTVVIDYHPFKKIHQHWQLKQLMDCLSLHTSLWLCVLLFDRYCLGYCSK